MNGCDEEVYRVANLDYGMAGEFLRDCFQEAAGRLPEPAQELLQTQHAAIGAVFRSKWPAIWTLR